MKTFFGITLLLVYLVYPLFLYTTDKSQSGVIKEHTNNYPTPSTINYFYGFGFLAGIFLAFQMLSGFFLATYYTSDAGYAFDCVEVITREIPYGWFFRNMHQSGASFFFLVVYIHMARCIYFKSFY